MLRTPRAAKDRAKEKIAKALTPAGSLRNVAKAPARSSSLNDDTRPGPAKPKQTRKRANTTTGVPPRAAANIQQSETTSTGSQYSSERPLPITTPLEPTATSHAPTSVTTTSAQGASKPSSITLSAHLSRSGYFFKEKFINQLRKKFPNAILPAAEKIKEGDIVDINPDTAKSDGCRVKFQKNNEFQFSPLSNEQASQDAFIQSVHAFHEATAAAEMEMEYELIVDDISEIKPLLKQLDQIKIAKFMLKGKPIEEEKIKEIKDEIEKEKTKPRTPTG